MLNDCKIDKTVDARGAYCPGPLMELIGTMKINPVGTVIEVLSSDKTSAKDIPEWVSKAGHEFIGLKEYSTYNGIVVRKTK
jgi:TusA-related sulfurtransferase